MSSCSVTDSLKTNSPYTDSLYTVYEKHWGVLYGGLVALKYLLPLNIFLFFSHYPDKIFQIFKECLVHSNDDVSGAAANVLYSFSLGVKKNLNVFKLDSQKRIKFTEFREKLIELVSVYLISVIEDLRISINSLDALSCRCNSLCNGWSSCCSLLFHCIPILSSPAPPSCPSSSSFSSSTSSSIASSAALFTQYQSSSQTNKGNTNNNHISYHKDIKKTSNEDKKKCKNNPNIINNITQNKYTTILTYEIILDVTVVLTSALSDVLLKLLLFCRRSQVRCLTALKPGKKHYFMFIFIIFYLYFYFHSLFCFYSNKVF